MAEEFKIVISEEFSSSGGGASPSSSPPAGSGGRQPQRPAPGGRDSSALDVLNSAGNLLQRFGGGNAAAAISQGTGAFSAVSGLAKSLGLLGKGKAAAATAAAEAATVDAAGAGAASGAAAGAGAAAAPGAAAGTGAAVAGVGKAAAAAGPAAPAVLAVAAAVGVFAAGAYAFKAGVSHFIDAGKELEKYSGSISAARARAEVRTLQGDLREAAELGGGISSLTDSSSQIMEEIRDAVMPIKRLLVEVLAGVMETLANVVTEIAPLVKAQLELLVGQIKAIYLFLTGDWAKAAEEMRTAMGRMAEAAGGQRRRDINPLGNLYAGFGGANENIADALQTAARQAANTPGFAGAW